jgi:agmatinase
MNFLGSEIAVPLLQDARVVILPVPYEQTTSYGKGTKDGPEAIIEASPNLEFYDEQLDMEPWRVGVHTAPRINCNQSQEEVFQDILNTVSKLVGQGKLVITLGGEHSVTFPAFKGVSEHWTDLSVVQLDAHSDLRDKYEGSSFSHACVMRRIWEINNRITGIGIRSQSVEEKNFIQENNIDIIYAHEIRSNGWNDKILKNVSSNVYLTFDVDYFDPSIMPATGTPEPGGFMWYETLDFIKKLFIEKNVVAIDVVELSPNRNHVHAHFTIARLIYKMIGFYASGRKDGDEKS